MAAYYNENDEKIAAWLRELISQKLIADGIVDTRSIHDVEAADLKEFTQHHFFAGIGGWSYALQLAGWPDDEPVWTGSCPCQPSSSAARGRLVAEELWPEWARLIAECTPGVLFGEQVVRRQWIDCVVTTLEGMDYNVGAAILPALGVGADHLRERIYFVGNTNSNRKSSMPFDAKMVRLSKYKCYTRELVSTNGVSSRMVAFSGFGNAIVPQVAAAFIEAYMEIC